MKLIIDISKETYKEIKEINLEKVVWMSQELQAIYNGKPVKETIIYDDDGIGHKVYKEV